MSIFFHFTIHQSSVFPQFPGLRSVSSVVGTVAQAWHAGTRSRASPFIVIAPPLLRARTHWTWHVGFFTLFFFWRVFGSWHTWQYRDLDFTQMIYSILLYLYLVLTLHYSSQHHCKISVPVNGIWRTFFIKSWKENTVLAAYHWTKSVVVSAIHEKFIKLMWSHLEQVCRLN